MNHLYRSIVLILFLVPAAVLGQSLAPDVPNDVRYKNKDDYRNYQDKAQELMQWVVDTPLNEHPQARKKVNTFLMKWMTGSPNVHLELHPEVLGNIIDEELMGMDFMIIYLSAMGLAELEGQPTDDQQTMQHRGAQSMVKAYTTIRENWKQKHLERLYKLEQKGKLKDWVSKLLI